MVKHSARTQVDEKARGARIAAAFAEFTSADVTPPDVVEFLKPFRTRPRTHNLHRAQLRERMRYAAERGYRPADSSPVSELRTITEKPRTRYITDRELRWIKVGAIYGNDGKRTRSGYPLRALIDMAYLTGQDTGVLQEVRKRRDPTDQNLPHVCVEGIFFRRAKVEETTGAAVLVQWTPRRRRPVWAH